MYIWVWCIYTSTYGVGFVLLVLGLRAMREPREAELQQWSPAFFMPVCVVDV